MTTRHHIPEAWPEERADGDWVRFADHQKAVRQFPPRLYTLIEFAGQTYEVTRLAAKEDTCDEGFPCVKVTITLHQPTKTND